MSVQLPTKPQTRASIDPRQVRVFVGGMPKSGKTTLLGAWAPATTLILDTQHGTDLLEGEHFVIHVPTWQDFVDAVGLISRGGHPFMTIGIDLIDDIWNLAGQEVARRLSIPAAALADFGKGVAEQEAIFRHEIGRLVGTPLGIWFLSHVDEIEGKKIGKKQLPSRMVPRLDKRIRPWLTGLSHFVFLSETLSGQRQLRTTPTADFEAGGRIPLPSPMPMDARALYAQIKTGLKTPPAAAKAAPVAAAAPSKRARSDVPSDVPAPAQPLASVPTVPVDVLASLRADGCTCEDPLRAMSEAGSFDEACPIADHGLPWGEPEASAVADGDEALAERLAAEHFAEESATDPPPPPPAVAPPPEPAAPIMADGAQVARLRIAHQGLRGKQAEAILKARGIPVKLGDGMYGHVPADQVDAIITDFEAAKSKPAAVKTDDRPVTPPDAVKVLNALARGKPTAEVKGAFALNSIDYPGDEERFLHLAEDQVDDLMGALS